MSKRSSRRKRQTQRKKQEARLTGPILAKQGKDAFEQADYGQALILWGKAQNKKDAPPTLKAAIAEAHFRQGVSTSPPQISNLEQATKLVPDDDLYRYHLALAFHQTEQFEQAEPIYRKLLAQDPPFQRAAKPLAQLLITQRQVLDKDVVKDYLDPATKSQLFAAEALIRKKARSTLKKFDDMPLEPLWRGLVAFALQDYETAQFKLDLVAQSADEAPNMQAVAEYYLGILALQANQPAQAHQHWQKAQAKGFISGALKQNLNIATYQDMIHEWQSGHPLKAAQLVEKVPKLADAEDLQAQIYQEAAYAAAQKGQWQEALDYWQIAERLGADSRKLTINLALAHQKMEQFRPAADLWRHLLRHRPRSRKHPEAMSDEKVARLWQNVAENYAKAGDHDEAITTYKTALKWAPENMDLRFGLVEALQGEGRWQAAENELNRILDKDPDNVQALILLAESYADDFFQERARDLWVWILEIDPQNPIAKQQLPMVYLRMGERFSFFSSQRSIEIYQEGLEIIPDSPILHLAIGATYLQVEKNKVQAKAAFDEAIALDPNSLQTNFAVAKIWMRHGSWVEADQQLENLYTLDPPVPIHVFIDLAEDLDEQDQVKRAKAIYDRLLELHPDDPEILVAQAGFHYHNDQEPQAIACLRKVLAQNPAHAEANFQLGTIYYEMDQTRLGKRHWDKAEAQARKEMNGMLLMAIQSTRNRLMYGRTSSPLSMFNEIPPHVLEMMGDQIPPDLLETLRNTPPEVLAEMLDIDIDDEAW